MSGDFQNPDNFLSIMKKNLTRIDEFFIHKRKLQCFNFSITLNAMLKLPNSYLLKYSLFLECVEIFRN